MLLVRADADELRPSNLTQEMTSVDELFQPIQAQPCLLLRVGLFHVLGKLNKSRVEWTLLYLIIFFSLFLFFNAFAINMWLQYRRIGKWSNYLYGERAYMILSLVAKSLLAWQVFGGTLAG